MEDPFILGWWDGDKTKSLIRSWEEVAPVYPRATRLSDVSTDSLAARG